MSESATRKHAVGESSTLGGTLAGKVVLVTGDRAVSERRPPEH